MTDLACPLVFRFSSPIHPHRPARHHSQERNAGANTQRIDAQQDVHKFARDQRARVRTAEDEARSSIQQALAAAYEIERNVELRYRKVVHAEEQRVQLRYALAVSHCFRVRNQSAPQKTNCQRNRSVSTTALSHLAPCVSLRENIHVKHSLLTVFSVIHGCHICHPRHISAEEAKRETRVLVERFVAALESQAREYHCEYAIATFLQVAFQRGLCRAS
jgi:hypothetical protein